MEASTLLYQQLTDPAGRKISKDRVKLNSTINKLHPTTVECTFFLSSHGTFTKINHSMGHKTYLSKFIRIKIIKSIIKIPDTFVGDKSTHF